ncbi:hypothetical protein B0T10DRAFT_587842, partial [Thelonectria olida]
YPLAAEHFPFVSCFDGTELTASSSGCLTTPPPYRMGTDSPASQGNMAFQPAMNQVANASFFNGTISTSPMSTQADFCFPPCSPQQIAQAKMPEDPEPLKAVSLTVEGERKPPCRPQNPMKPQKVSAKLEDNVSKTIADRSKRKKHGRKPKLSRKVSSKVPTLEDSDGEAQPGDPRRRRILKRNKIAAIKCRLRKREEASALASREQAMEDQNRDLSKSVDRLPPYPSPFQPNMAPLTRYQRSSSGSIVSVTNSHDIFTPEMESVPPTCTDPLQQYSSSLEVGVDTFNLVSETIQTEPIPVSCQPISSIPSMHEDYYKGTCIGTGALLQP